jgi:hypothetical protein
VGVAVFEQRKEKKIDVALRFVHASEYT